MSSDTGGEPYELPRIVPATEPPPPPPPPAAAPRLPAQQPVTVPAISTPRPPAPVTAAPAPATPSPAVARPATAPRPAAPVAPGQLRGPSRRPRVRRVTRVLRHIDPWSTFKVALVFSAVAYIVTLTSGVLLWRVADSTGTLDNVERWFTQFGWETFELKGGEIFHNAWIIGLFGVVATTGGAVLLVTLFNLVSDIVGGVRLTVLEEEVVERTISSTRRYVVRNTPNTGTAQPASAPTWSVDDDLEPTDPTGLARPGDPAPTQPVPTTDWSVE